ncbi:MAG: GNAT family N-acetyltransferase [Planctomycetota bacterium]
MLIRKAEKKDFEQIAALDRIAWQDSPGGEYIPDGSHVWAVWVEKSLVYCAEENGEILGVAFAFPCIDGEYWLHKAFVSKNARGKGVGTKVFAALLEKIDELNVKVSLTVDPTNERAITLYEKQGFDEKTLVKDYYGAGKDRYVMTRKAQS